MLAHLMSSVKQLSNHVTYIWFFISKTDIPVSANKIKSLVITSAKGIGYVIFVCQSVCLVAK